jgi:hypothetical protein
MLRCLKGEVLMQVRDRSWIASLVLLTIFFCAAASCQTAPPAQTTKTMSTEERQQYLERLQGILPDDPLLRHG